MRLAIILLTACSLTAAPLKVRQAGFAPAENGLPAGWLTWSARPETAPKMYVDALRYRQRPGSLAISGNSNPAAHGGWEYGVDGVESGAWYRFTAYYRSEGVPAENWQVVSRLDWADAKKRRVGQPDYAWRATREGAWTKVSLEAQAPDRAERVKLQLYLSNAPQGTVWWDEVSLEPIPTPKPRTVRVASVNLRPARMQSAEQSVGEFLKAIAGMSSQTDLILLPEGITVIGTSKTYAEVSEPVPGPTTARLGEMAKQKKTYIAAGIYEREGAVVYNTAVLIDRSGNVAGKYRKVYLPREEVEKGITPGNDYPVFQTDFGTIGMMICYDVFFAEPARALANRGAEIILLPIWGGDQALGKARAIETGAYLVASGYDYPTYVMDPAGEIVSEAKQRGNIAFATLDLERRYKQPFLGDMHGRRMKELRTDVKSPKPGFVEE